MRVFLSYAGELEDQIVAQIIGDRLSHFGYEVLMNFGGIVGGENWKREVGQAIHDADWFIALVSPHYEKSSRASFQLLLAFEYKKSMLPLLIERTTTIPPLLAHFHFLDMSEDVHQGIDRIIDLLEKGSQPNKQQAIGPTSEEIAQERQKVAEEILPDRIFIAYSHKQRILAKELADLLTANGNAVFYDAKIKAGATWRQTIQKALDDATHLVVIWTSDAAKSDEVEREVSYALAERKVIVPILSKEITRLPYHLHGLHYIMLNDNLTAIESDLLKAIAQFSEDDIWQ